MIHNSVIEVHHDITGSSSSLQLLHLNKIKALRLLPLHFGHGVETSDVEVSTSRSGVMTESDAGSALMARRTDATEHARRSQRCLNFLSEVIFTPTTTQRPNKTPRLQGATASCYQTSKEVLAKKKKKRFFVVPSKQWEAAAAAAAELKGQSSASNRQISESEKVGQSRSPTDEKQNRNHQNCVGNVSYHFIVFTLFS